MEKLTLTLFIFRMNSCWLCTEQFSTRKGLKLHIQTFHGRLSVICTFCDSETSFKRVSDLKVHVRKSHQQTAAGLPPGIFNEGHGFWWSLYPQDYQKVITRSDRSSSIACQIRTLVLDWAKRVNVPNRSREFFLSGWKEAENLAPSIIVCEPSTDIVSSSSLVQKPRTEIAPHHPQEMLDSVTLVDFNLDLFKADFVCGLKKIRVLFTPDLVEDKRAISSISRRPTSPNDELFKNFLPSSSTTDKELFANFLGIHRSLISSVLTQEVSMSSPRPAVIPEERPALPEGAGLFHMPDLSSRASTPLLDENPVVITLTPVADKCILSSETLKSPVKECVPLQETLSTVSDECLPSSETLKSPITECVPLQETLSTVSDECLPSSETFKPVVTECSPYQ